MILVDIYIPSIDTTYDFMLDENVEIEKLIVEIYEMVAKKMQNSIEHDIERFTLYHMSAEKMLDKKRTLSDSGVKDGHKLMLL